MPTQPPFFSDELVSLKNALGDRHCIAFLGAGLSATDYPPWSALLPQLCKLCDFSPAPDTSSALDLAEELRRAVGSARYEAALRHVFRRTDHPTCAQRYHWLARMPFKCYVTTNFDPLLVDTLSLHTNVRISQHPHISVQHMHNGELHFIHGRMPQTDTSTCDVVLTRSDFARAYHQDAPLPPFLTSLYEHDLCFIGCGFTDEYLANILITCEAIKQRVFAPTNVNPPRWYAIVPHNHPATEELRNRYGLRLVTYPPGATDDDHSYLDKALSWLAGDEPPQVREPARAGMDVFRPDAEVPV